MPFLSYRRQDEALILFNDRWMPLTIHEDHEQAIWEFLRPCYEDDTDYPNRRDQAHEQTDHRAR